MGKGIKNKNRKHKLTVPKKLLAKLALAISIANGLLELFYRLSGK